MEYRCVTTSVEGFVQQLAVAYITHGYWFYVTGTIPEQKDPAAVDAKLIERYGIAISKWARCRRKKQGLANMQYLRHERFFVLLATKGRHDFFERERTSFRDVRRVSIKFAGYNIGCRKGRNGRWHVSVRISPEEYLSLKACVNDMAQMAQEKALEAQMRRLCYARFVPVRRQLLSTVRSIDRARKTAGYSPIDARALQLSRCIVRPFSS